MVYYVYKQLGGVPMEQINFESYFYRLNIAGFENWSSEELQCHIESAKNIRAKIKKDIYDSGLAKKFLPPTYVVDGYVWARKVIYELENELKKRGVIKKTQADLDFDSLFN